MSTNPPFGSAIVTGGSQGLGRALVTALAGRGWQVTTDARGAAPLDTLVGELGTMVTAVPGDIANATHRADLVRTAEVAGALRLVIANAGTLGPTPLPSLADVDLESVASTLAVNTTAQLGLVQLALPALRAHRGVLVLVTSDAAVEGYEGWGVYGASKAALEHLGRVLAAEEPDVRVLVVDPGDMRTAMHQAAFPGEDISDRPLPESSVPGFVALIDGDQPSGRYRAMEVAP